MKRRLIINIDGDDITDERALALVAQIVDGGRVSETAGRKHYCHATQTESGKTIIRAFKRTATTDSFTLWNTR